MFQIIKLTLIPDKDNPEQYSLLIMIEFNENKKPSTQANLALCGKYYVCPSLLNHKMTVMNHVSLRSVSLSTDQPIY